MSYSKQPEAQPIIEEMESRIDQSHERILVTKKELKELVGVRNEVACVLGDTHFPYEDKEAIELFFAWLKDNRDRISRVFFNGDMIDNPSLSKFVQNPRDKDANVTVGLNAMKGFMEEFREITECPTYYIPGNHCLRLEAYLKAKAPELYDIVKLPELLDLDEFDIKWIPAKKDAFVQYGKTLIGHFNKVSKHSAYTAKGLTEDFPSYNIVQNHTHRRGLYCKNGIWAVENSNLADVKKAGYIGGIPNWQSGFMDINTDEEGGQLPEFIRIIGGKLYFRDDTYE